MGQLEDRDCSRTSAPLQCHHDDNDGSESDSGIAPIERSKKPVPLSTLNFPKVDLSEGSELDDDLDVCEDDPANFFVSD